MAYSSKTPLRDRLTATEEGLRLWNQERSIFETTELICELLEKEGVKRKELAARLGTNKSYITKLLDGAANMTLRTISDVFTSLGYEFHPKASKRGEQERSVTGWSPEAETWSQHEWNVNFESQKAAPELQVY